MKNKLIALVGLLLIGAVYTTEAQNFTGRTRRGSAAPASVDCDAAGERGTVYVQTGDPASVNLQVFRCTQTGAASYAWHPVSHLAGTTAPTTCVTGAVFFDTDATAGLNWFGCTAANTWTLLGDGAGGGTINNSTQFSVPYYSSAGSTNVLSGVAGPTTPNDVDQILRSTPSAGAATAPTWALPGVPFNAQTGTTYTVLATDRGKLVTTSNASAIAVTLPQAGSAGFTNNFYFALRNIGAGAATITPTTSTINLAASITLGTDETVYVYGDNTNYTATRTRQRGFIWLPAAACQNATASLLWDTPTSSPAVAACITGTNTQKGVADFADAANLSMQLTLLLPTDFNGNVDAKFKWLTTATTGDVVWQLATICVADAETDDPAFNTASTVTDTAKGTTNQTNDASITNLTMTGCAAGELLHIKLFRDSAHASDTLAATARLIGLELMMKR